MLQVKPLRPTHWRVEKYGGKKRWKKLHLAIDLRTGKLILSELSEERVHDTVYMEKALLAGNRREGKILIDGIADSRRCYSLAQKYNKSLLTPPKKRGVIRSEPELERRNEAIKIIRRLYGGSLGKAIWSQLVGYSKRVIIESAVARWKRLYGGEVRSRHEESMRQEVLLKARMINQMIEDKAAA